jgi:nucleotide-binding universal stress UspA family protein
LVPRSSPGIRRRPIIEYARGHGVDLIVMGHRGMSNLQRFFVGSVADRVVDHAPCMVLVVRAADNRR